MPLDAHLVGVLIAAICLFPIALWIARGKQTLPAFELICIAYLLAFGMPLYLQPNQITIFSQPITFAWEETYRALCLSALGISVMIFSYYAAIGVGAARYLPRIDLPMDPRRQYLFFKLAFGFSLAMTVLRIVEESFSTPAFDAIVRLLNAQVFVAIILLAYRVYRGQENRRWTILLYVIVGFTALTGLSSGMLENALVPLVLIFIVRWSATRKLPFLWVIGGLFMFVILNSVKGNYRSQAWYSGTPLDTGGRISLWLDLSQQSLQEMTSGGTVEDIFRRSMSRFDLLHSFVHVQQMTPLSVPYYEGETYAYILYGWIPRFFWPDKPIAQEANVKFAVDYRLMSEKQTSGTMIGIGHLPEAYANFGIAGILFVMAVQGSFLAAVNTVFNGPDSEGGGAIYLSIIVFFLNGIGSATAALFMALILNTVVNAFLLRRFAKSWRTPTASRRSNPRKITSGNFRRSLP